MSFIMFHVVLYVVLCGPLSEVSNPKELVKEALQLINHTLFFLRTATAAKARNRRHQLVNIRANIK